GEGGRERLHDRLVELGARVDYVECYQRSLPEQIDTRAMAMWRTGEIDGVTLTRKTVADHLRQLLRPSDHDLFEKAVIATVSTRIEQYCRQLGCTGQILVSAGPGDEALVSRINDWRAPARRQ
ncbi:MAG: uroporphyrinogen-III synthase, partial [Pseudomonadota bacterium]|nr:uroporphyrinogen-III synthase [Pseudomonadota bacterium]